ncbi:MAG: acyl transferase [Bacteroidia bacterium]|nr:acyl transferase [Bacteroidia bacterium]
MTFDEKLFIERLFAQDAPFEALAEELWNYQRVSNPVIREFVDRLGWEGPVSIPIEFFKEKTLKAGEFQSEAIFQSSGTTGQQTSKHHVKSLKLYEQNLLHGFNHAFPKKEYKILALLPSYLERNNSSLVYMVNSWIESFGLPGSGFFLYNFEELKIALQSAILAKEPILIIGVSFALLDFVDAFPISIPKDSIVIETGGMKGRKKEMIRSELHAVLQKGFGIGKIHSEYGMTEMMSQAYTREDGRFVPAPTLRVWTSDFHLQKLKAPPGKSGRLHLIDLANIHSCAFIATDDIGRVYEDGSFEVLGRIDTAELRGCNLMYI